MSIVAQPTQTTPVSAAALANYRIEVIGYDGILRSMVCMRQTQNQALSQVNRLLDEIGADQIFKVVVKEV
jgi:hypothetical protein